MGNETNTAPATAPVEADALMIAKALKQTAKVLDALTLEERKRLLEALRIIYVDGR